jgi:hypothetical protein
MNKEQNQQDETNEDAQSAITLQNMMFEQMKRLSDPNNDLDKEIKRSQALSSAGTVIINAAKVRIDAVRVSKLIPKNSIKSGNLLGNGK